MSEGLKLRRRWIINKPTEGPETCPHLEEAMPCEDPACYSWQLVRLDPCVPRDEKTCGPGSRFAHVKCVNNSGESTKKLLHMNLGICGGADAVKALQRCSFGLMMLLLQLGHSRTCTE